MQPFGDERRIGELIVLYAGQQLARLGLLIEDDESNGQGEQQRDEAGRGAYRPEQPAACSTTTLPKGGCLLQTLAEQFGDTVGLAGLGRAAGQLGALDRGGPQMQVNLAEGQGPGFLGTSAEEIAEADIDFTFALFDTLHPGGRRIARLREQIALG